MGNKFEERDLDIYFHVKENWFNKEEITDNDKRAYCYARARIYGRKSIDAQNNEDFVTMRKYDRKVQKSLDGFYVTLKK